MTENRLLKRQLKKAGISSSESVDKIAFEKLFC